MNYPKRLIEVDLPIREISKAARSEKNRKTGHISSLYMWWARRPLAACRSVICGSLWIDPADECCEKQYVDRIASILTEFATRITTERNLSELVSTESWKKWKSFLTLSTKTRDFEYRVALRDQLLVFIADFSEWDAAISNHFLDAARQITQASTNEITPGQEKPFVADPFAGGGALPLEASRIGSESFASDLNPIAFLLNKLILEYMPRHRHELQDNVKKWSDTFLQRITKRISHYYENPIPRYKIVGYLWARTIKCEGPKCGVEVPIIKNFVVSDRKKSEVAIEVSYKSGKLITEVVFGKGAKQISGGTSKRSSVTCPKCGFTTQRPRVEVQSNEKGFGFHLLAIVLRDKENKRSYRQPVQADYKTLDEVDKALIKWSHQNFNGISAIPYEELPYLRSIFNVRVYGIDQWQKLFQPRQLLAILNIVDEFRTIALEIKKTTPDGGLAEAIIESLALAISNSFQYQCNIATYLTEGVKSAFIQGQSLPMKMDFIEANPLIDDLAGGIEYSMRQHLSGLNYLNSFPYEGGVSNQVSATRLVLPDNSLDLLSTDPPYYDVVPYADCSDFFYVWLRRMLSGLTAFPGKDELTPKNEEIVQLAERNEKYKLRTKKWFEDRMCDSLRVARTYLKTNGIAMLVFAHKETAAWEALLQSVLNAGWRVTASWPIDTEKGSRLRANESAVLGSSIHLIARPREINKSGIFIGDWREILNELPKRIHEWMPRLAKEGVVGADAIFACLGPALEIFSKYDRVEKANGDIVSLSQYLENVWASVAREALIMIFEGADASGFEEDARLTAMWLWTLSTQVGDGNGNEDSEADEETIEYAGFSLEYDAARKIAQGIGAHLEELNRVVEIKGDVARLISIEERRAILFEGVDKTEKKMKRRTGSQGTLFSDGEEPISTDGLKLSKEIKAETVLDQVHQAMILFGSGRTTLLKRLLVEDGVGKNQRFWKLSQALNALYPKGSNERRWVEGVQTYKKSLGF